MSTGTASTCSLAKLTPGPAAVSDVIVGRVANYVPRDASLKEAVRSFREQFETAVFDYGNISERIVADVCRHVATVYALSVAVDRYDPAEVWNESNIRYIARQLKGSGASPGQVETFVTRMMRIGTNKGYAFAREPHTRRTSKQPPYNQSEIEAFLNIAAAQPNPRTRWELDALIALCLGTGATSADIRALQTNQITVTTAGVDVALNGKPVSRVVPVAEPWAHRLTNLINNEPDNDSPWFIGGNRSTRTPNLVHRIVNNATWADVERLSIARLRTTWIVSRLTAKCRIDHLVRMLGETTYTSISHAAAHLPAARTDTFADSFRSKAPETPR